MSIISRSNSKLDVSVEPSFDYMFKIILVGDSGVGKTAFLSRYCDDTFINNSVSTVGIDFRVVNVVRNGKNLKIQLWDTAGQERYHSMTTSYYHGANGFVVLFDIAHEQSFNNCSYWFQHIHEHISDEAAMILVGNKSDLSGRRKVQIETAQAMAENKGIKYFECSTKENRNIKETFDVLIDSIINTFDISVLTSEKINVTNRKTKKCQCTK